MQVREIMTPAVETVTLQETIRDAAVKMRTLDVGSLPVCDGERILGMLTDRDIAIRSVAEGQNPDETAVEKVMTRDIEYCLEDQDVDDAAAVMQKAQIRRLPVVNREKRLVGILALGDIATCKGEEATTQETIREVSQPH